MRLRKLPDIHSGNTDFSTAFLNVADHSTLRRVSIKKDVLVVLFEGMTSIYSAALKNALADAYLHVRTLREAERINFREEPTTA